MDIYVQNKMQNNLKSDKTSNYQNTMQCNTSNYYTKLKEFLSGFDQSVVGKLAQFIL